LTATERRQRPRRDIHAPYDFFEYVRIDDGSVPPADRTRIDVALLDMNHSWPNVGHDSLVHAILAAAAELRDEIVAAGIKVRVISYDVRRRLQIPSSPNGRFQLYVGTGGPGHLDPRMNNGRNAESQGIDESIEWEAPLFRLFDAILGNERAALLAVCHSFGLMCRWSGAARVADDHCRRAYRVPRGAHHESCLHRAEDARARLARLRLHRSLRRFR